MNWWVNLPQASPMDAALQLEGVDPQLGQLAQSVYMQESSGGRNTQTSNAGAVGGMQIIPSTFRSVADEGWDINDPVQNARAGVRYLRQMYEQGGNDPRMAAIGYYGGPGAIKAAQEGRARSDPRNPNAPNTFQYADQVVGRIPASETGNWWESLPLADEIPASGLREVPATEPEPGPPMSAQDRILGAIEGIGSGVKAFGAGVGQGVGQVAMGAQEWAGRGLDAIGADSAGQWLINDAQQGRANLAQEAEPYAQEHPFITGAGRIGGNIAATLPVGGALGSAVGSVSNAPRAAQLANALRSGGMNLGGQAATTAGGRVADLAIRAAGGAATGGAIAGLVNPDDVGTGAAIGAAFPIAGQAVASGSRALGRALRGGDVADDVVALAKRARDLGIDIPADRIANSRPLNAVSSSLEYVPFSGRTATLDKMQAQFNRAISRTFGQNSDNVTKALRDASTQLGDEFDRVLRSTSVRIDPQFTDDLAAAAQRASSELESGQARIILNQIDEIMSKAHDGVIDGQAAYNIKRTLDRIGKRDSPEGFYADELRKTLMDALNRSLGPRDAQRFAKLRQQYGNMLTLRRFAQNGVDGDVSIARIANMRDIRSPELQELADIAAQFLKPREGAHGAAQRVVAGGAAAMLGGPGALAATAAGGRLGNALLNSDTVRRAMLGQGPNNQALAAALRQALPVSSRVAPVLAAQ